MSEQDNEEIINLGKQKVEEFECPKCGGKAVIIFHQHYWGNKKGIGVKAGCINKCYILK